MSNEDTQSDIPEDVAEENDSMNPANLNTDEQNLRAVNAEMPEHQFDQLDELKDYLGLTWKGFLLMGYRCMLENYVGEDE